MLRFKALQITKARVTAVSNSLIDKGLIKLERNQADRRKVDLFLTDKGIQKIEDDIEMLNKRVSYVLDELGEEKVRDLIDIIGDILDIIKKEGNRPDE